MATTVQYDLQTQYIFKPRAARPFHWDGAFRALVITVKTEIGQQVV